MNRKLLHLNLALMIGGMLLCSGYLPLSTWEAKGNASPEVPLQAAIDPISNTHTAPITSSIALSYNQAIIPGTVTSRTIVIHAMQTGQITQVYSVNGSKVRITPKYPFKSGELVQVTATTQTVSYYQDVPFAPTVWQFRTGVTVSNGLLADSGQRLGHAYSYGTALGDLDRDGDIDMVTANYNRPNTVWLNLGNGRFVDSGQRLGEADSTSVNLGDVDGDGDLDAFVANWDETNKLWLNDGHGYFKDSQQALGETYAGEFGDVDGDGDLDLFTGVHLWFNDGQGYFLRSEQLFVPPKLKAGAVTIGDLDQDYDLDLIVSDNSRKTGVWLNQGNGSFHLTYQTLDEVFSINMALGDVDSDQDLDLLITDITNNQTNLWLNSQQALFTDGSHALQSQSGSAATFADIDGDGDLDALIANPAPSIPPKSDKEGGASVWLNDGQGEFSETEQHLGRSSVSKLLTGDLDNDGDLELIIANLNQPNTVWFNNERPILQLQQTSNITIAKPGDKIDYRIVVSNSGAVLIDNVVVTANLPAHSNLLSTNGYETGREIKWSGLSLGFNESRTLKYSIQLDNPLSPQIDYLESQVVAQGFNQYDEPTSYENNYQLFIQHPGQPFLTILANGPPTATLDSTVTYSFTVKHHTFSTNPVPVSNVIVYHSLTTRPLTMPAQGDLNNNGWLDFDEQWLFEDRYTIPNDTTAGKLTNESYATGINLKSGAAVSPIPHDTHLIDIEYQPILSLAFTPRLTDINQVDVNQPIIFDFQLDQAAESDGSQISQLNVMNSLTGQADCSATILTTQPISCTATYLIQPTDTAPLAVTATVEGIDRDGDLVRISRNLTIPYIDYQPQLTLTLEGPRHVAKGETVPYTVTLRHADTSDRSTVGQVLITHSMGTEFVFQGDDDNRLSPNESWVYTTTFIVQEAEPTLSELVNSVTVTGLDRNNQPTTVTTDYRLTVAPFIIPLQTASLTHSRVGLVGQSHPFTVTIAPISTTPPLKYHWSATEQRDIEYTSQSPLEAVSFSWDLSGSKKISVTVSNLSKTVTISTSIDLSLPNRAPMISQAMIMPTNPDDQADLELSYDFQDLDGDRVETEITWLVDGLVQNSLYNSRTVPAGLTGVNNEWCAQIVARDYRGASSEMAETCVRIQPGPLCTAPKLDVTPFGVTNTAQDLQLSYELDCRGGVPAEAMIRWYRDGQLQPGLNQQKSVSAEITLPFEGWHATVTACISGVCDPPLESNTVYIAKRPNSPPTATVTILPSTPLANQPLALIYSIHDGDETSRALNSTQIDAARIWWYRNDVYQPLFYKKRLIDAAETHPGEVWCVEMQPYDGQDYGPVSERHCVAVGSESNHAPQLFEVSLGQTIQSPEQSLRLRYNYQDMEKTAEDVSQRRIRWYRNGSYQPAFTGKTAIPARFLLAGDVWQSTLQVYDGELWSVRATTPSAWLSSSAENTPPSAQNVRILPNRPETGNHLQLVYDYLDADGQPEGDTRIYWYDNPLTRTKKFDGLTKIPAAETNPDQVWHVRVIPHDGQAYGKNVQARSIRVEGEFRTSQINNAPFISNIFIDPTKPGANDNLAVVYVYRDQEGDPEGNTDIEWRVNGLAQSSMQGRLSVSSSLTLVGDSWCAFVTPVDVRSGVGQQVSACAEVSESGGKGENTPPIVRNASVKPSVAIDDENLVLDYDYIDPDGDDKTEDKSEIFWYRIDRLTQEVIAMPSINGTKYVPANLTTPGDKWYAELRVHDGEDYSPFTKTESILINRPPQVSNVHIEPVEANERLSLEVMYVFTDPDELTPDESEIQWYLDGQLVASSRITQSTDEKRTLPSNITRQNQVLTVSVRPSDGYEYGAMVSSAEIVIGPPKLAGPIYLPMMVKSEPKQQPTSTPTIIPTVTPTPTPLPCTPPRRYEDNDGLGQPCRINLRKTIAETYPDDQDDYYDFMVVGDKRVVITIRNYKATPQIGNQIRLYHVAKTDDGGYEILNKDLARGLRDHDHATLEADLMQGLYYIRVYTIKGAFNPAVPYTIALDVKAE